MNIRLFIDSMNDIEKKEFYNELKLLMESKTDLKKWAFNHPNMSMRLLNILETVYKEKKVMNLEDVCKKDFDLISNAGVKSWFEFVSLRGY